MHTIHISVSRSFIQRWDSPTITEYSISIVLYSWTIWFLSLNMPRISINPSRCMTDTHMHPLHVSTSPFPPEKSYMKPWYEYMYEQAKTIEHISFTNARGMTSSCALNSLIMQCSVKLYLIPLFAFCMCSLWEYIIYRAKAKTCIHALWLVAAIDNNQFSHHGRWAYPYWTSLTFWQCRDALPLEKSVPTRRRKDF